MRKILLLILPAFLLFTSTRANASTISWSGAGSNDSYDWSQLGPEFSNAANGFTATSANLATATLSDGVGFTNCQEQPSGSCLGNFALNDWLLISENAAGAPSTTIDINFAAAVAAVGSQVASNAFGAFTVRLDVYAGAALVGTYIANGVNDGGGSGPINPFLGAQSDAVDLTRAVFTLTAQTGNLGEIIGTLRTSDTPFRNGAQVPEPATLGLVGMGVLAAIRRRRQSR
jgi:PEP-CTERM motif